MEEKKRICMIDLSKGILDNDYTFYEDGTIERNYDRNSYPGGYNLKEWPKPNEMNESLKEALLAKCPEDKKAIIKKILFD